VGIDHRGVLRWYDPFLLNIGSAVVATLVKALLRTCSVIHIEGKDTSSPCPCIYVSWHQRMFFFARYLAKKSPIILISQSRDGEYGARIAKHLGFGYVRGSSTRGGIKAVRQMIEHLKKGRSVGILADGPLGPPRVAKTGPILIASKSGVPIVPLMWSSNSFWILNSWDRYIIPKPFSKIVIRHGDPLVVPSSLSSEEVEYHRKRLQNILNSYAKWCDEFFGVKIPCKKEK